jgi:hypothetical protein
MAIYHYCTLFDSYYLSRALAMHSSMQHTNPNFHLYIFAFDSRSEQILKDLNLSNVTVISLQEFENERLLAIKPGRNKGEYCWTCTPSVIDYCITTYNLDHCTYIDADLYFFSNPNNLVDEMGSNDVLITEHRYTKKYDQSATSGIYCVQFVTFKNTSRGMAALHWWRDRCIEWCYDRFEDGKFGDQKYMDDWTTRFQGVHVLQHLGGGLAPWNIQQFNVFEESNGKFTVEDKQTKNKFDVIFFHFHAVRFMKDSEVDLGSFSISAAAKKIYRAYLTKIREVNIMLQKKYNFNPIVQPYQTKKAIPHPIHKIARRVLGVYNVHPLNSF